MYTMLIRQYICVQKVCLLSKGGLFLEWLSAVFELVDLLLTQV